MLLNCGQESYHVIDDVNNEINLITLEVLEIEKDEKGEIVRIHCSNDKILIAKDGFKDLEEFNLEEIKKGDILRLKVGQGNEVGFSIIYEATFAGVDTILGSFEDTICKINRFSIGNLSFDEKYFMSDVDFFEKRINNIFRLIGLLGTEEYLNNLNENEISLLKDKIKKIGEEIIELSKKMLSKEMIERLKSFKEKIKLSEDNFIFLLDRLKIFTQKGELIKSIGEPEFDLKNLYELKL